LRAHLKSLRKGLLPF